MERGSVMATCTDYISVSSRGNRDVIDLTPLITGILGKNQITDGIVAVFCPGSTAAITTIEYEPGLRKDIDIFLERLFPYGGHYHHHETWNDDNGSSHIQAAMLGPGLTVPLVNGKLTLGTWQQIVLVDCDTRPRKRKVVIQIVY